MTVYSSGAEQMRAYAATRIDAAQHTLSTHRSDGTGCCVVCGRPAPCERLTSAGQTFQHYRGWLDGARVWIDDGDVAQTVRPYVREAGHGDRAA